MATAPRPNETWFTEAAPANVIGLPVLVGALTTPVEAIVEEATPETVTTLARVEVAAQASTVTVTTSSPAEVDKLIGGGTMVAVFAGLLELEYRTEAELVTTE